VRLQDLTPALRACRPSGTLCRHGVARGHGDQTVTVALPQYHAGYYAAFVIDPDGNNVEAVFHGDSQLPAT
jgi:hypothetical protein